MLKAITHVCGGKRGMLMLRLRSTWLLLALVALLTGCQPVDSFNPLYQDKDVVFDASLVGKWTTNNLTMEVIQSGDNGYTVVFIDDSTPPDRMVMDARLVNLEGHRFMDVVSKRWAADPDSYRLSIEQGKNGPALLPRLVHAGDGTYIEFSSAKSGGTDMQLRIAHWFFRLNGDAKSLSLDYIDDDRLTKALDHKAIQIKHTLVAHSGKKVEIKDSQLLLTATTAELQKFVLDHVNDDQVFADSLKFVRSTQ